MSSTSVPLRPSSAYQTGRVRPEPAMLRQSRASRPSFPWRPDGCSESAPSFAPWYPIAVTDAPGSGSWIRRFPTVASSVGRGRIEPAPSERVSGGSAVPAFGEPPPKAVRASVTATRVPTTASSTRRRARSWARRWRARRRAACRERGEAIGPRYRTPPRPLLSGLRTMAPRTHDRHYHGRMTGPPQLIRVPRWIQLVGLPVLVLLAFLLAQTSRTSSSCS